MEPAPQPGKRGTFAYGLDAPGVVWTLVGIGGVGLITFVAMMLGAWSARSGIAMVLFPVMFGGAACGLTGLWLLWYSAAGKVRSRERRMDQIPWQGDERVLDVGCGRGLFLIGAAKRLTKGGRAYGIDLWRAGDLTGNGPDATFANATAEGVADRITVVTADARALPFDAGSFDVVLSSVALHNIPDAAGRAMAVSEIARVLRPDGRVLITDIGHVYDYAEELRRRGVSDVVAKRSLTSYLGTCCTMGAVRFGVVAAGGAGA
jgi:ubiquinone/menaquinone biosynthesis C-methylase UbiE